MSLTISEEAKQRLAPFLTEANTFLLVANDGSNPYSSVVLMIIIYIIYEYECLLFCFLMFAFAAVYMDYAFFCLNYAM